MTSFYENKTVLDKILLSGFLLYLGAVFIAMTTGAGPMVPLIEWCREHQANLGPVFASGKITIAIAALVGIIPFACLKFVGRLLSPETSETQVIRSGN